MRAISNHSHILLSPTSKPNYPGIHQVAVAHFEVKPSSPVSHGVLASLFYPTDTLETRTSTASWLPGPSKFYAVGYGDFIKLPRFLGHVIGGVLRSVSMPAVKASRGAVVASAFDPIDRLPVLVFSHGLGVSV
jgi:hypothetical protein